MSGTSEGNAYTAVVDQFDNHAFEISTALEMKALIQNRVFIRQEGEQYGKEVAARKKALNQNKASIISKTVIKYKNMISERESAIIGELEHAVNQALQTITDARYHAALERILMSSVASIMCDCLITCRQEDRVFFEGLLHKLSGRVDEHEVTLDTSKHLSPNEPGLMLRGKVAKVVVDERFFVRTRKAIDLYQPDVGAILGMNTTSLDDPSK